MKYLTVCNHLKSIVDVEKGNDPRRAHPCSACVGFDLKLSIWRIEDVRAYRATEKDLQIVGNGKRATKGLLTVKRNDTAQIDWVGWMAK